MSSIETANLATPFSFLREEILAANILLVSPVMSKRRRRGFGQLVDDTIRRIQRSVPAPQRNTWPSFSVMKLPQVRDGFDGFLESHGLTHPGPGFAVFFHSMQAIWLCVSDLCRHTSLPAAGRTDVGAVVGRLSAFRLRELQPCDAHF